MCVGDNLKSTYIKAFKYLQYDNNHDGGTSIATISHISIINDLHRREPPPRKKMNDKLRRRRLSPADSSERSSSSAADHRYNIEHVLSLATRPPEDHFTEDADPLRVLFIVTTLAEYNKGTRGTIHGAE